MATSRDIGLAVKEIRKAKGMTQAELADATGRSTDAISQIERGVSVPSVDTLVSLTKALSTSVDQLLVIDSNVPRARSARLAKAYALLSELPDAELEIAIRQISAFRHVIVDR